MVTDHRQSLCDCRKKSLVNSHHDPHFLDMDTVKNIISNADIWKITKILFFKKNEIY